MHPSDRRRRAISIVLLLVMTHASIAPSAFALSSQYQPEYTHYESSGSTDMVNLATGDFQYSLPLLHVPGPNGGFSLPLTYSGGIQLDQDASWVGLGWSMNAGSIMRQVSQYADDVNDGRAYTNAYDPGGHGHSINFLGVYKETFDSEKGKGGSIGIGNLFQMGFGNEAGNGAMLGMSTTASMTENLIGLGSLAATLIGGAAYVASTVGKSAGATFGNEIAKSLIVDAAQSTISEGIGVGVQSNGRTTNINDWKVSTSKGNFFGKPTRWKYSLDVRNREERMFGALYLGDMPTSGGVMNAHPSQVPTFRVWEGSHTGPGIEAQHYSTTPTSMVASDSHYDADGKAYVSQEAPTSLAYDSYNVMAGTVSGNITPYRAEVGSTSYPMVNQPSTINGWTDFQIQGTLPSYMAYAPTKFSTGKVPFRYENEFASSYEHHIGLAGAYNTAGQFGAELYMQTGEIDLYDSDPAAVALYNAWRTDQGMVLQDQVLYDEDDRIEADRTNPATPEAGSYKDGRVIQGKHIEWYTNGEIAATIDAMALNPALPNPLRLIHYDDPDAVNGYDPWAGPGDGIGGLAITSADGTTYHFALPVLNRSWWVRSGEIDYTSVAPGDTTIDLGLTTITVPLGGAFTETASGAPHAVNWLLTAITGPDYVDRGALGRIDAQDWGNWVKFDYGCHTKDFYYRSPYLHNKPYSYAASSEDPYRKNLMRGHRDAYYLDRIETPSHVALFVKDVRKDGKSDYNQTKVNDGSGNGEYRENFSTSASDYPSCSLRLSEIRLFRKSDLDAVLTGGGPLESRGGEGSAPLKTNHETPGNVLDVHDINSTLRDAMDEHQLLRVAFVHDYTLCQGTWNSFDLASGEPPRGSSVGAGGKLTLKRVEMHGRNDVKLMADHVFDYEGSNPSYNVTRWDGWGMYAHRGGFFADTTSYRLTDMGPTQDRLGTHEATDAANGWELTKITTPTGAVIEVEQERDTYSSVAGKPTYLEFRTSADEILDAWAGEVRVRSNIDLQAYPFLEEGAAVDPDDGNWPYARYTFVPLGPNEMRLAGGPVLPSPGPGLPPPKIYVQVPQKYGGDLRVRSIRVTDPFSGTSTASYYRYTQDGTDGGVSSGVCAVEPEFCRAKDETYFREYDYPVTPVIYRTVTTLIGAQPSGSYGSKRVYTFRTPRFDMVRTTIPLRDGLAPKSTALVDQHMVVPPQSVEYSLHAQRLNYCTDVTTSGIGVLEKEEQYDSKGFLHKRTEYGYEVPGGDEQGHYGRQGIFTEGSLQAELMTSENKQELWLRMVRSTKRRLPTIPTYVTITEDGLPKTVQNTAYDYITGAVAGTEYKDAWGILYRTRSVPAFRKYAGMGPVGLDPGNANILSAVGEEYLYTVKNDQERILNANVTTFKKGWTHRYFAGTTFTTSSSDNVWRSDAVYAWKGRLEEDGSYRDFVDFNWEENGSQNSGWQQLSRTTRYDRVSRPVEVMDINGQYAGTRYGHNDMYVLGSGALARYSELRCSGAEERLGTTDWFDSEIRGADNVSDTYSHTGQYSVRVDEAQKGFRFTASLGTGDDQVRRQAYRVSVWVHKRNWQRANLYYKALDAGNAVVSGGLGQTLGTAPKFRAGNWYLLELEVPEALMNNVSVTNLEVGAENIDTELSAGLGDEYVYFDDFRFHPFHSAFSTNVYDPVTGQLMAALDANNLATRYTYDEQGRLIRTEVETKDGFVRSKEYSYTFARE